MAWSITVNRPHEVVSLARFHEEFAKLNPMYPVDMELALHVAQALYLGSATLAGGRTPIPGVDDEVVMISITGTVKSEDFLDAMQAAIRQGPDPYSRVGRHHRALIQLEMTPCTHEFRTIISVPPVVRQCVNCEVRESEGLFFFDEGDGYDGR